MTSSSAADESPRWPVVCGTCGEEWAREVWPELPPVGRYSAGSEGWLEIRSCVCGKALVIPSAMVEGKPVLAPRDDAELSAS